jgi:hypothetical protein
MSKIRNQFFNQPKEMPGLFTYKKSVTIPGQDFTPQEILRNFTQGRHLPHSIFTDIPVDSFTKMNIQEKMDHLRSLSATNKEQKTQVQNQLKKLQEKQNKEIQQKQQEELTEKIKADLKKQNNKE